MYFIRISLVLFAFAQIALSQDQSFESWVQELRQEARLLGLSEKTLLVLDQLETPLERVLELDNSQPEFVQTFSRYLSLRVTPNQIRRGIDLIQEHKVLLDEVRQVYGVQPHYLMAFWAVESNYGRNTGGFSVLQALATLAFDPRRAEFFREQLLIALQIIDAGHIEVEDMSGSWAGAMGQLQFMPNIFSRYGIDGDGDGRVDIWKSLPDIFHSAANFLSQSGWRGDERWGREVVLPADFDFSLTGTRIRKPLEQWRALGVVQVNGDQIPVAPMSGSVVLPSGAGGPAFLVYNNFRTTMTYNPSTFYALTVGHLADRFTGGGPVQRISVDEQALSVANVRELQTLLNDLGFNSGEPDGRVGSQTRSAIRAYQEQRELPTDGHPSTQLLKSLREQP